MKIAYFIPLVFLFVFFSGSIYSRETMTDLPSHPRILMTEQDEKDIHAMISSDQKWSGLHDDILKECDNIIDLPQLERKQIGMRLLAVSREAFRRIFYLSYAYRMTGEEKYLKRGEHELLTVSNFKDWNPSHFLDVAEMTTGVALGYDWLYSGLSKDSRSIIREAILQKGIAPSFDDKYNWFLKAKHNWNQVCNTGMLIGALAVYEEDRNYLQTVIDRSIASVRLPMNEYAPDGAYPEGYSYWEYGTTFNVLLISALGKAFGKDFGLSSIPGFADTGAYYEHMIGTTGKSFNYADCGDEYGLSPAMFWFARKAGDPSLLWLEKDFISVEYKENYLANRFLPAVMIWGAGFMINNIQPPAKLNWSGNGKTPVVMMRTSWTGENAVYVGFKGGTAGSNHAHMDAGSFVMDANNVRWAMDFGMQDYESLESRKIHIWSNDQNSERWNVFRYNNYTHNTLTVNSKLHDVKGCVSITSSFDNSNFRFALADLSSLFPEDLYSCKRGIALVDEQYVIIRDEIIAFPDRRANIRWTMLTPADVKILNDNRSELFRDGKKLRLEVICDYPVGMKTWSTQSSNEYDAPNPGTTLVGFECVLPPGKSTALTVLLLPEDIDPNPEAVKPLDVW